MLQKQRRFLTPSEIDKVLSWIKRNKHHRDYCLILLSFRHGLRPTEAVSLKWEHISIKDRRIFIPRLKNSKDGLHILQEDEVRAISKLHTFYKQKGILNDFLFISLLFPHTALTRHSFNALCKEINKAKIIPVKVSPHSFRHSCGYYLVNKGYDTRLIQDYLGHKNINNTVIYTSLSAERFKEIKWN